MADSVRVKSEALEEVSSVLRADGVILLVFRNSS